MAGKKAAASKSTGSTKKTSTAKKTATKAAAGQSAAAKKAAPAKKSTAKKTTAKKTSPAKSTAKTSTAKKAPTKKSSAKKAPAKKASKAAPQLVVREDESPWTAAELDAVRTDLEAEIERVRAEIASAELDLSEFLKEPIDGAGDDQADAGAKSFEREHELSLVAGSRAGLEQNIHALERLENGTYGVCESCGNPIGKLRLQAYPRATLCVPCKSKQERR